ncbi:hypothetical protein [Kribbella deserti]|uniref:Uncharacterized protein n=1 Tax=Kribbella deserti TaxID=1926257 RepID=A0ABV6QSY2_9ACTN
MQLRGPMIAVWDELLPRLPDEEFRANARIVATALAEVSGETCGLAVQSR